MVVGSVGVLRDVEERWGPAEVAGGAPVCRIHERLHKRVILGKTMSKGTTRRRWKGTSRFGIRRQRICPKVIVFKGKCRSDAFRGVACEQLVDEIASLRAKSRDNSVS